MAYLLLIIAAKHHPEAPHFLSTSIIAILFMAVHISQLTPVNSYLMVFIHRIDHPVKASLIAIFSSSTVLATLFWSLRSLLIWCQATHSIQLNTESLMRYCIPAIFYSLILVSLIEPLLGSSIQSSQICSIHYASSSMAPLVCDCLITRFG